MRPCPSPPRTRPVLCRLGLLLAFFGSLLGTAGVRAAQDASPPAAAQTVNVELILDASGSMDEITPDGQTRIEAAKQVLREVIEAIPERAGINVGLRVFGHKGTNTEPGKAESCASTELLVPVAGVDREALRAATEGFAPVGWTPITLALEAAAADFSPGEGVVNAVILVTDGIETCGRDPCAAATTLHASEVQVQIDVVGFGTDEAQEAFLGCIAENGGGSLYGADDGAELSEALFASLAELEVVPTPDPAEQSGSTCATAEPTIEGAGEIVGTPDQDVIFGSDGPDAIDGGGGDDLICGLDGDDVLIGGDGQDEIDGGDGNDQLAGGPGDDRLFGRDNDDLLDGGPGNDFLFGDDGGDLLTGGDGDDELVGGRGDDALAGDAGNDRLVDTIGRGSDSFDGGPGEDGCTTVRDDEPVASCET